MLFNSISYAIFFPVVFILYWFITKKNLRLQNGLLLVSSYYFYASWDYRFLFLLVFSTLLDYFSGIKIEDAKSTKHKKFWLWLSIGINLGFLGVFKYFNFFVDSFANLLQVFGVQPNITTLNILLPVGISFYTFHGLSYIIDIYKQEIKAERNFVLYAVFVSFFPLLVAGPIERATHLLPQLRKDRIFNKERAIDGLRQILWGLFKKVVIADSCAEYANMIFNDSENYSGITLVMGAVFFAFQIYCDFSGYSDIALGSARLLGIELLQNFSFPYFSRDIAEFWRRWHISLSSWFKDYIYIPLGGSRGGIINKTRNTFIIFIISGFWHGANWTFIAWGALNALFFLPLLISGNNRNNLEIVANGKLLPSLREFWAIISTFAMTSFAWVFFRAEDINHAINYIYDLINGLFQKTSYIEGLNFIVWELRWSLPVLIVLFFIIEWFGRSYKFALEGIGNYIPRTLRWIFYYTLILCIFYFSGQEQTFIYFQF